MPEPSPRVHAGPPAQAAGERNGPGGSLETAAALASATPETGVTMAKAKDPTEGMTEAQKAYEARRAAKAGMSLEKWLAQKEKAAREAARAAAKAAPPPPKKRGLIGRMLDRARGEG